MLLTPLLLLSCAALPGPAGPASPQQWEPERAPIPHLPPDRGDAPLPLGDRTAGEPAAWTWTEAFFPDADMDPDVRAPEAWLRQPLGSRVAAHDEVLEAFAVWAATSDRLELIEYGQTHEGRPLIAGVFAAPERRAELQAWLDSRFSDDPTDAPLVTWLGYGIHGDEPSATDAALAMGWYLAGARDERVQRWLENMVVVIDPCLNPDGRERIRTQLLQLEGYQPSLDHAAMQRGRWPHGRGNHYLFDMNRDWVAGVAPETRARWRILREWRPQVLVDGHEMGPLDTFLFYPQNEAHLPYLPSRGIEWQGVFADDQARAFDAFGWGYYTREWADGWAPFYSDAWASLNGAIGLLYEQARTLGQPVRREGGEIVSYRESVHGQVVSSLANLETAWTHRTEILDDFRLQAEQAADNLPRKGQVFCVRPMPGHPERMASFEDMLRGHGIEYAFLESGRLKNAEHVLGERFEEVELPAGTLVVWVEQQQARLIQAFLEFDPRFPESYLNKERKDLELKGYGNTYDVTAWDLGHALGLDALWGKPAKLEQGARVAGAPLSAQSTDEPYALAVDGAGDAAPRFAAAALEAGLVVHASDKPFTADGREFARGSLLLRQHENELAGPDWAARARAIAARTGVDAWSLGTGRSADEGPDLGGGHFIQLVRPRVALLSNDPVEPSAFGHLWHHLDHRMGIEVTLIDAAHASGVDWRRYNVLVLPDGSTGGWVAEHADSLRGFMEAGGTLIAAGWSALACVGEGPGLSSVTLRSTDLENLASYRDHVNRERAAGTATVDAEQLYGGQAPVAEWTESEAEAPATSAERDQWMQRFMPSGVYLRARLDPEHWLTYGADSCGSDALPVIFGSSSVMWHRGTTPVRLEAGGNLRLGGLLWPEGRERLEYGAYATVENVGAGQLILFATDPVFRGYHLGTARLFSNAVVYGPGLGARPAVPR
ncbi:MAG: M14 family zinc carboxypeptidase [Planctomycetota bacterium]|jgi:hypothetical protein